jgi:uncharacterized membrane protein YkvA (DUF1232 family)
MSDEYEYDPLDDDAEEYLRKSKKRRKRGFKRFLFEVGTLARMARAVAKGEYELATPKIALMLGTLGYVVSPVDALPDVIPVVGLTDDAAVVTLAVSALAYEIALFRQWEEDGAAANYGNNSCR